MLAIRSNYRRGAIRAGVVAVLALLIALAALFLALFRDPLGSVTSMNWNAFGSGMSGYNFSTPEEAYKSSLQIELKRDIRAKLEMDRLFDSGELQEQANTVEFARVVDIKLPKGGRGEPVVKDAPPRELKLLFISWKRDGQPQYGVVGVEKHAPSGLWRREYVSEFDVEPINKDLAREMRDWKAKGAKAPPPIAPKE